MLTTFILISIVLTMSSIEAKAEDYLGEFSLESETCEIIDYFYYDIKCPTIFNSDSLCTRVPVFYACCKESECSTIIFDIQKKSFLEDKHAKELIDLNYIKYNLHNGNLSMIQFDLNGFDVCTYFGKKELRQESLNLGASVAQNIDPSLSNKINTAKKLGKVSKFNPTIFIASVGCNYDNDNLEVAMESLSKCN